MVVENVSKIWKNTEKSGNIWRIGQTESRRKSPCLEWLTLLPLFVCIDVLANCEDPNQTAPERDV